MFAMLHGPLPVPADPGLDPVRTAVAAQVAAGLGVVTAGGAGRAGSTESVARALAGGDTGPAGLLVRAWRDLEAALADVLVTEREGVGLGGGPAAPALPAVPAPAVAAMVVPGPIRLAGLTGGGALVVAALLASELAALADAGCPMVIVAEAAADIGDDPAVHATFADAHRLLLLGVGDRSGLHAMLALEGGPALDAWPDTVFAAPYRSHLFDLVAAPDSWRLVRAVPAGRGIVCAAMRTDTAEDQLPMLVWAARYAASGRPSGLDQVGIANAGSLADHSPAAAAQALGVLGRAARLAVMPLEQAVESGLDPRTIGSRAAAVGTATPRPRRLGGRPPA